MPMPRSRPVIIWLIVCLAMIFAMVVIGGVTRLTESGLSITEWRPITGALPPLTDAAWAREFELYRQSPQYRLLNLGMTIDQFRAIFWWEYIHRLWGRLIGIVFALPFLWFLWRGTLRGALAWRLGGIFLLGALQGAIGWWMVASGLEGRMTAVSAYRLALHLLLALLIYGLILWLVLDWTRGARRPRWGSIWVAILAFVTIASGAFVAGNDAGLTFNTYPLMDGRFMPHGYIDPALGWRSLFENVAAVQFNHRWLASATVATMAGFAARMWPRADRAQRRILIALVSMAFIQITIGIMTLLLVVPISLAALHQAGAVLVLTAAIAAAHAFSAPAAAAAGSPRTG